MKKSFIALICSSFLLTACNMGGKQTIGAGIGAIGGGVVGSTIGKGRGKTVATIAGALIGGLLGSEVGASLDKTDQLYAERTTQSALETAQSNTAIAWSNPDSGHSGTITPTRTYQNAGRYCREFQQTVVVAGRKQSAYGTACREPDGSWRIIN
jgi:surface antigen